MIHDETNNMTLPLPCNECGEFLVWISEHTVECPDCGHQEIL